MKDDGFLFITVLLSLCLLIHVGSCLLDTTAVSISDLLAIMHPAPWAVLLVHWSPSLASQPYFSAYAHAKVGGGREGKIRLGRPARFSWLQLKS